MTFSKSASLCDTEGSYICVIPCKLRLHVTKQLEKVCLSWCFSRQLCIVHCVGCSVAAACFLPVHWGGLCFVCTPGDALPSILLVFVLQKLPEHTVEKQLRCSPCQSSRGKTVIKLQQQKMNGLQIFSSVLRGEIKVQLQSSDTCVVVMAGCR